MPLGLFSRPERLTSMLGRFHDRPVACGFFRNDRGVFVSLCGRHAKRKIGKPELKTLIAPQKCARCDVIFEGYAQRPKIGA